MADKPSTVTPPQGNPVMAQEHPCTPRVDSPWLRLAADPELVREARDYALAALAENGVQDVAEDVRLVVSELVTNAMRAAQRYALIRDAEWAPYERPVLLRVICRPYWVHVIVTDPDSTPLDPAPADLLDLSGRGLSIVDSLAALRWWVEGNRGKAGHVVVTRSNVKLRPEEVEMLTKRVIL